MEREVLQLQAINLTHDKIRLSTYFGTQNGNSRQLAGPYALSGLTPHFYILGEADFQFVQPAQGNSTRASSAMSEWYEILVQGLHLYLMQQTFIHAFTGTYQPLPQDLKYGMVTNRLTGVGPGIYWYPRPHFYFQLEVQQQFSAELPSTQTSGFLTGNIYL